MQVRACRQDAKKLCPLYTTGDKRIAACLDEKTAQLSRGCADALRAPTDGTQPTSKKSGIKKRAKNQAKQSGHATVADCDEDKKKLCGGVEVRARMQSSIPLLFLHSLAHALA